ncbi:dynein axonemal heavy chain 14 [Amazona ochrocephala]
MTLPTTSACKGVQHGFGTPPLSYVHVKVPKMTERGLQIMLERLKCKQRFLEPSCHKKTREQPEVERSSKKPFRNKVYSYDRTEAIDDDAITHILRLQGKLGWQTNVQSAELLPGEADVARFQKFTLETPLVLEDSGEYIYCLQPNGNNFKAPYNPYDLQVVSVNTAMHSKIYWTVSASYVSKFSADPKLGQMEITAVPRWLHERQIYYKLRSVKFISSFK